MHRNGNIHIRRYRQFDKVKSLNAPLNKVTFQEVYPIKVYQTFWDRLEVSKVSTTPIKSDLGRLRGRQGSPYKVALAL